MRSLRFQSLFLLLVALAGCASLPTGAERAERADALADAHGWVTLTLPSGPFSLVARTPKVLPEADELDVYIEGDGLAWISSNRPSADPTPVHPLAFELALAQPSGHAVYLARPCQYLMDTRCAQRYWTSQRFAPEVIAAMDAAVDQLKARARAQRLVLVGYSGGGAVAALLAARRDDVVRLVTVAGNLDHAAWTTWHRISPLDGSLNPADVRARLRAIPQWHFVGGQDKIIPARLVEDFARTMPDARVRVLEGNDHHCCWAEDWPRLWQGIEP